MKVGSGDGWAVKISLLPLVYTPKTVKMVHFVIYIFFSF